MHFEAYQVRALIDIYANKTMSYKQWEGFEVRESIDK